MYTSSSDITGFESNLPNGGFAEALKKRECRPRYGRSQVSGKPSRSTLTLAKTSEKTPMLMTCSKIDREGSQDI